MKKIFFSIALLTTFGAYAAEVSEEQAERMAQQNSGDQLALQLLQIPQNEPLLAWFTRASDDSKQLFRELCKRFATLNIVINSNYTPMYKQLFNELTELTGTDNWAVQLSFVSDAVVQTQDEDGDDSDDSEGSADEFDSAE